MVNQKQVNLVLAEVLGTSVLVMSVYTILARTGFPFFTGVVAGLVAGIMIYVLAKFSSAHLNPAVTFGLWSVRKVKTTEAILYIGGQFLGALLAWALIKYFLGRDLTSLAGDDFSWKVFTAEAVGGFIFLFGVASAIAQKLDAAKTALTVGGSLALAILVASLASNGVVNPAVAVGIQSWSWAYAVAPLVGGVVGANVYHIMATPMKLSVPKIAKKSKSKSKKK